MKNFNKKLKCEKLKGKNYSEKNRSYCMWMLCNSRLIPFTYLYFLLNLNQLSNSNGRYFLGVLH